MVFIYITISFIVVLSFAFFNRSEKIGSDHPLHVNIVDRIKKNNHLFLKDYVISYGEQNPYYPQLFHWGLSFLKQSIYKDKSFLINLGIKIIEFTAFNVFLYAYQQINSFEDVYYLITNIVVNFFPISYVTWNAKNRGLTARGIGVVLGQVYLYILFFYCFESSVLLFSLLTSLFFIIILTSQITTQFVLLGLFSVPLIFGKYELFLLPLIAYGAFLLLMPHVAISYFKGQFNHKRNYALYNSKIYLFKARPSIYRDFVYDFWINLKKNLTKGIVYIYYNPIIEIVYGLPYLWLLLYDFFSTGDFSKAELTAFGLVVSCLICFILTSFKWTRFLGEPQRYLEFSIPLITVLSITSFDLTTIMVLFFVSLFFILISSLIFRITKKNNKKTEVYNGCLEKIKNEVPYLDKVCISNDNQLLKHLTEIGMNIIKPDTSSYIKDETEFYKLHYKKTHNINSPFALDLYSKKFNPDYLVINNSYYTNELLNEYENFDSLQKLFTVDNYEFYKLNNVKEA